VRVILADDAMVVREGLARLLAEQGVEVLAQAGNADELQRLVAADQPDVAVIDIRMPPTYTNEGLRAAQEIRDAYPRVGTVVLSQYVDVDYALRLITETSERVGYLLKDQIVDIVEFVAALERVAAGGTVVEPSVVEELVESPASVDPLAELTRREREVLALIAQGKTDRGIAKELFVTRKTVEAHVRSILSKLDLPADASENRRVHAVLAFLRPTGGRLPHTGSGLHRTNGASGQWGSNPGPADYESAGRWPDCPACTIRWEQAVLTRSGPCVQRCS
jgi:DNA-binding NarL/FixJ family response regulator